MTPSGSALFAALHGLPIDRLAALAGDFSPRFERHPGGIVVADIAGLQRLFGDERAVAGAFETAGVPRVAAAGTWTAALLLVRARPGVTIAAGDPAGAVRDLPIAVLKAMACEAADAPAALRRGRGAGTASPAAEAFAVLDRWGVATAGELAALPPDALSARLGAAHAQALQALARGADARPLVPDPGVKRFIGTFELEWPVDALEPLSFVFARVLEPLAGALEAADRGAVALHATLRLTDRTMHVRDLSLPSALRDARVLRTLLMLDLDSHPPAAAVDAVSIELDPAPARIVQYSLLERAVPAPETLATLVARLGALVGDTRCGSPVPLDTHRPDAFAMEGVSFGDTPRTSPGARVATPGGGSGAGGSSPCPERGGARGVPPSVLRRFRPPVAVRVLVEGGRPVRVAIDRRGMPGGVVTQAAGPWRTSGDWWDQARWNRDEWDVSFGDGAVCRLFCDRERGGWFLDGVFD